jgi:hypothetical protein
MSTIDYGEVTLSMDLYQLVKDLLDAYKANIENAGAVAQGDLVNAATYEADKWVLRWKGETLTLVLRLPDYWKYIEEGRGPTQKGEGGKLYPAILDWVKIKIEKGQIVPRADPKTKKVPKVEQLAYAITKKIHKRGYFDPDHHGKYPLREAIQETDIVRQFAAALTDQFNRIVHVELSENLTKLTKN